MTRTWDAAATAVEVCPVCASLDVRVIEPAWFVLQLERGDDLRDADPAMAVEFACRECGASWD